jgi:hypothetical protein
MRDILTASTLADTLTEEAEADVNNMLDEGVSLESALANVTDEYERLLRTATNMLAARLRLIFLTS